MTPLCQLVANNTTNQHFPLLKTISFQYPVILPWTQKSRFATFSFSFLILHKVTLNQTVPATPPQAWQPSTSSTRQSHFRCASHSFHFLFSFIWLLTSSSSSTTGHSPSHFHRRKYRLYALNRVVMYPQEREQSKLKTQGSVLIILSILWPAVFNLAFISESYGELTPWIPSTPKAFIICKAKSRVAFPFWKSELYPNAFTPKNPGPG